MFKVACLVAAAICGVLVLVGVMVVGATRRQRFERFADAYDGHSTTEATHRLQKAVDTLYGRREFWPGASARLTALESNDPLRAAYLLDLHARIEGTARRTVLLVRVDRHASRRVVSERPDRNTDPTFVDDCFESADGAPLPDDLRRRLADLPDDREWLLEYRASARWRLVGSRDRALSDRTEWRQLLEHAAPLLDIPSGLS